MFQEWEEYVYNNIFKKHYDTWIAKQKNLKSKENSKDYEIYNNVVEENSMYASSHG